MKFFELLLVVFLAVFALGLTGCTWEDVRPHVCAPCPEPTCDDCMPLWAHCVIDEILPDEGDD